MDSARILLTGGGAQTQAALQEAFSDGRVNIEIVHAIDADTALHALVAERFQLCVVRANSDAPHVALSICADIRDAGLRIPIIVLMDITSAQAEEGFLKAGALSAIPWDGSQGAMLRNFVKMTLWLRKSEDKLRHSNDQLIREMRTLQDERERAEAANAEYVELAESYALAKHELEILNQQKNKFFSIIAHDLRSPFTSLLGFSALLVERAEKLPLETIKEFATHIHDSGNRVFTLLENLLEWSRLQMNRIEVEPHLFSLHKISAKTIEVLSPVAAEKNITLVEHGEDIHAYADPYMIDAVIRNLVNNAIKFTPNEGTITLEYATDETLNQALIHITDTGVGMTAETLKKLFKMSETVSTKGTDGEHGTGLGLLLCHELVHRNAGHISVKSKSGIGSTFTFTLPLSAPVTAASEASARQESHG